MSDWHCLGTADDYRDGKPHAVRAFDTDLVVYSDRAGGINVLDSRCPHMGADLSKGRVVGDTIDCPAHRWRWNGRGKCVGGSPKLLPIRSWTTEERDGLLYLERSDAAPTGRPVRAANAWW